MTAKKSHNHVEDPTLEEHLQMGMGSIWLAPLMRDNVIILLRRDAKVKLDLLRKALKGRGHTYERDPKNGEYYASMTEINQLLNRLEREAGEKQ